MSDLDEKIRHKLMVKIFQVEKIIKQYLNPDKINLASLGNITPHLHWHIIPRYFEDNHFPDSIWSEKKRNITNEFSKEEENKFIENIKYNLNN
jgi:diadenosine tetraphosphate (Ap4A) HIT family hydrolase|tara:strand:- start:173 stop:451 length:279 start_codon:yes stop_codon:yes gene_type:complete